MRATIISEHDGWEWHVKGQEDCPEGVILLYKEQDNSEYKEEFALGCLEDAEELARAILKYVEIVRNAYSKGNS